jgi:hypothetical protein
VKCLFIYKWKDLFKREETKGRCRYEQREGRVENESCRQGIGVAVGLSSEREASSPMMAEGTHDSIDRGESDI